MNKKMMVMVMVMMAVLAVSSGAYYVTQIANRENSTGITKIDVSENIQDTKKELSEETIKIAVSAMISPKETLAIYGEILDYIGKKIDKKVVMVQRKTYDEVNDLIEKQEVFAAFVCSGPYVNGHDKFGMEIIAIPQMYGETVYYSYILVSKDSAIKSFSELRGKTFAFTDPKSNTGKIAPTYMLAKMGETPDSFFEKYVFTGSHDNSIEAVSKKLVDGAAVDHLIYEYLKTSRPDFVANVKVIEKYGPYGIPPFVVHPKMDEKLKSQLKDILLNMDNDPEGKKLINNLMIDKFVAGKDEDYASVREMENWIKNSANR